MNVKKSLLISHNFLPGFAGGMEVYYHNLCTQLSGEIEVLTPRYGDWQVFDAQQSYPVHRRSIPLESSSFRRQARVRFWALLSAAWMAIVQFVLYTIHGYRIVHRENIGAVLIGHLYLAPVGWAIRLLARRPYAIFLHGSELPRFWHLGLVRRLIVALLNGANFLMVNSEFTRRQYLARGVRADQTFVRIHPGVDLKRFLPNLDASPIVRRHGLAGRPLILTVGRLVEWKGQDMVMRALPYVLQAVPTAAYVVVGEGPYRKPLERLVAELKLHDHVIFAGFVPAEELAMYYRAADVTVLVSREICPGMPIEGFGMVYLEANAAGRPVIGSRMGGVTEAVLEGVTGLLVNPNDEKEIAAAIMRLLTDRVLAEHMGLQGRARAARELSWQTQAAGLRRQLQMRAGLAGLAA